MQATWDVNNETFMLRLYAITLIGFIQFFAAFTMIRKLSLLERWNNVIDFFILLVYKIYI